MELLTHKLSHIKHVALDMDGTIYRGAKLFEFTVPFLETLRSMGIGMMLTGAIILVPDHGTR